MYTSQRLVVERTSQMAEINKHTACGCSIFVKFTYDKSKINGFLEWSSKFCETMKNEV